MRYYVIECLYTLPVNANLFYSFINLFIHQSSHPLTHSFSPIHQSQPAKSEFTQEAVSIKYASGAVWLVWCGVVGVVWCGWCGVVGMVWLVWCGWCGVVGVVLCGVV